MKQSHWLLFVAKKCDWSRKITPSSRFPRDENLERKQNSTAKSTNLEENGGKQRQFLSSEQPCKLKKAWSLTWVLQELKNTLRKLAVAINTGGHSIRVWMNGALVTVEICALCGWFSNQFDIVSKTLNCWSNSSDATNIWYKFFLY